MSISLVVGGVTYVYPTQNSELWSTGASDWAEAVTTQLQLVSVTGDIGPFTLVTILNNQASPSNVTGLILNPANIRAGIVEYFVQRVTGSQELSEVGHLYLLYNDLAASWTVTNVGNNIGVAGTNFSVTASGQVRYTTNNLAGQLSGVMKYRLRILQKV